MDDAPVVLFYPQIFVSHRQSVYLPTKPQRTDARPTVGETYVEH
jgi:hypothetical protein